MRCEETSEIFGIRLTPSGGRKKTIEYLKNAALDWAGKMRLGNSSTEMAWTNLHTNIGAKLKYPLLAYTFIYTECKSIMSPAIRTALPRVGISSYISSEFRDGPIDSLGAGVLSLFHYIGTSCTSVLIDQLSKKTQLGDIMIYKNTDIVMDAGLSGSLWELSINDLVNMWQLIVGYMQQLHIVSNIKSIFFFHMDS